MTLNQHRNRMLSEIVDAPGYYHRHATTSHCGRHGVSYHKSEGCHGCRHLSVLDLTNLVYDRHVKRAGK